MSIQLVFLSTILTVLLLSSSLTGSRAALTEDEKEEILNAHNYYRRSVSPIATNMEEMVREC